MIRVKNFNILYIYGMIIVAAIFIGFLITRQNKNFLLILGLIVFGAVLLRILKDWRWGLMSVCVWFVIVDLIRKYMEGTKLL